MQKEPRAPKISGIYAIVNTKTGRSYIGKSKDIHGRWIGHRAALDAGDHINSDLQGDWEVYGTGAFEFKILEETEGRENLRNAEARHWSQASRPYNITPIPETRASEEGSRRAIHPMDLLAAIAEWREKFLIEQDVEWWAEHGYGAWLVKLKEWDERLTRMEAHRFGKVDPTLGSLLFQWLQERQRDFALLDEIQAQIDERTERMEADVNAHN